MLPTLYWSVTQMLYWYPTGNTMHEMNLVYHPCSTQPPPKPASLLAFPASVSSPCLTQKLGVILPVSLCLASLCSHLAMPLTSASLMAYKSVSFSSPTYQRPGSNKLLFSVLLSVSEKEIFKKCKSDLSCLSLEYFHGSLVPQAKV